MRKSLHLFSILGLLFCLYPSLSASGGMGEPFYFDVDLGYRQDQMKWSIGGPGGVPELLSELKWNELQIYQVMTNFKFVNCYNIYFRAYADYGKIFSGTMKDTDFFGNKEIFERSTAHADKGEVFDLSGAVGYQFDFLSGRVSISPLFGYSWHEQHICMNHLFIEFSVFDFCGPIPGLNSNYQARWYGPFVGADLNFHMTPCWSLVASGEYHFETTFRGKGHWNLRPEFIEDFRQGASAWGEVFTLGIKYDFPWRLSAGIMGVYQNWHSWSGRDQIVLDCGRFTTKFNGIRLWSYSVLGMLAFNY